MLGESAYIPCIRRHDQHFLQGVNGLLVHALHEVEVRQLGPALAVGGGEAQELHQRRDGIRRAAHGPQQRNASLGDRLWAVSQSAGVHGLGATGTTHNVGAVFAQHLVVLLEHFLQVLGVLGIRLLHQARKGHDPLVCLPEPRRQPLEALMRRPLISRAQT